MKKRKKKHKPPTDEFASKNGKVIVIKKGNAQTTTPKQVEYGNNISHLKSITKEEW